MANTHSFVIRTLEDWQDDSINCAGVAEVDLDNGQFVTRGKLGLTTGGGYEFACALPEANATDLWLVETPPVGDTLDEQIHDDPRYFYNKAQETRENSHLYGKKLSNLVNPIYREALPYLEKSYAINPNNEDVKNALRDIYYKLGEGEKLQAIEAAR